MPAIAYAALIRIVRSLEESDLYPHEVEILRGAADARLLADLDREERMAEAEELLRWLVESERMDAEVALLLREQLHAISAPAVQLACEHRARQAAPRSQRSLLRRALRAILGLPLAAPVPQPQPQPAPQPTQLVRVDSEVLDDATLAALAALDELQADQAETESEVLDAAGRPFDADRLHEQAESLLAFHAWLDQNDRR
jgi:hypothetical protein